MKKQELEYELEKVLNNLSKANVSDKIKAQILTETIINIVAELLKPKQELPVFSNRRDH